MNPHLSSLDKYYAKLESILPSFDPTIKRELLELKQKSDGNPEVGIRFHEKFRELHQKVIALFGKVDTTETKKNYRQEAIICSGELLLTLNNYFQKLTQHQNPQQILPTHEEAIDLGYQLLDLIKTVYGEGSSKFYYQRFQLVNLYLQLYPDQAQIKAQSRATLQDLDKLIEENLTSTNYRYMDLLVRVYLQLLELSKHHPETQKLLSMQYQELNKIHPKAICYSLQFNRQRLENLIQTILPSTPKPIQELPEETKINTKGYEPILTALWQLQNVLAEGSPDPSKQMVINHLNEIELKETINAWNDLEKKVTQQDTNMKIIGPLNIIHSRIKTSQPLISTLGILNILSPLFYFFNKIAPSLHGNFLLLFFNNTVNILLEKRAQLSTEDIFKVSIVLTELARISKDSSVQEAFEQLNITYLNLQRTGFEISLDDSELIPEILDENKKGATSGQHNPKITTKAEELTTNTTATNNHKPKPNSTTKQNETPPPKILVHPVTSPNNPSIPESSEIKNPSKYVKKKAKKKAKKNAAKLPKTSPESKNLTNPPAAQLKQIQEEVIPASTSTNDTQSINPTKKEQRGQKVPTINNSTLKNKNRKKALTTTTLTNNTSPPTPPEVIKSKRNKRPTTNSPSVTATTASNLATTSTEIPHEIKKSKSTGNRKSARIPPANIEAIDSNETEDKKEVPTTVPEKKTRSARKREHKKRKQAATEQADLAKINEQQKANPEKLNKKPDNSSPLPPSSSIPTNPVAIKSPPPLQSSVIPNTPVNSSPMATNNNQVNSQPATIRHTTNTSSPSSLPKNENFSSNPEKKPPVRLSQSRHTLLAPTLRPPTKLKKIKGAPIVANENKVKIKPTQPSTPRTTTPRVNRSSTIPPIPTTPSNLSNYQPLRETKEVKILSRDNTVEGLTDQNRRLIYDVDKLDLELMRSKELIEILSKDNENLRGNTENLCLDNQSLQIENKQLSTNNVNLSQQKLGLEAENEILSMYNEDLYQKKHSLEIVNKFLFHELEQNTNPIEIIREVPVERTVYVPPVHINTTLHTQQTFFVPVPVPIPPTFVPINQTPITYWQDINGTVFFQQPREQIFPNSDQGTTVELLPDDTDDKNTYS